MEHKHATEPHGIDRLRAHLHHHNRWVLGLTVATIFASVALWAGLYFVTWWLVLLGGTAVKSGDFHPASGALAREFALAALILCIAAWFIRRMHPNEVARDNKSIGEHLMDVILCVPRITLSIFGTGGAAARLNESELRHAWALLLRMSAAETQHIHVQQVPVDIPDPRMRDKILLALQLAELIDIRPGADGPYLAFRDDHARELAQERVRLRY